MKWDIRAAVRMRLGLISGLALGHELWIPQITLRRPARKPAMLPKTQPKVSQQCRVFGLNLRIAWVRKKVWRIFIPPRTKRSESTGTLNSRSFFSYIPPGVRVITKWLILLGENWISSNRSFSAPPDSSPEITWQTLVRGTIQILMAERGMRLKRE